jgi:hypothetical protein
MERINKYELNNTNTSTRYSQVQYNNHNQNNSSNNSNNSNIINNNQLSYMNNNLSLQRINSYFNFQMRKSQLLQEMNSMISNNNMIYNNNLATIKQEYLIKEHSIKSTYEDIIKNIDEEILKLTNQVEFSNLSNLNNQTNYSCRELTNYSNINSIDSLRNTDKKYFNNLVTVTNTRMFIPKKVSSQYSSTNNNNNNNINIINPNNNFPNKNTLNSTNNTNLHNNFKANNNNTNNYTTSFTIDHTNDINLTNKLFNEKNKSEIIEFINKSISKIKTNKKPMNTQELNSYLSEIDFGDLMFESKTSKKLSQVVNLEKAEENNTYINTVNNNDSDNTDNTVNANLNDSNLNDMAKNNLNSKSQDKSEHIYLNELKNKSNTNNNFSKKNNTLIEQTGKDKDIYNDDDDQDFPISSSNNLFDNLFTGANSIDANPEACFGFGIKKKTVDLNGLNDKFDQYFKSFDSEVTKEITNSIRNQKESKSKFKKLLKSVPEFDNIKEENEDFSDSESVDFHGSRKIRIIMIRIMVFLMI